MGLIVVYVMQGHICILEDSISITEGNSNNSCATEIIPKFEQELKENLYALVAHAYHSDRVELESA